MRRTPIKRAPAALALAALLAAAGTPAAPVELVPELTPYYTALGLYVPLGDEAIPETAAEDELVIYRDLLLRSFRPQVLLLEASVYPLPLAGTWLRRHHAGVYDNADVGSDINWLESVTAGFQEPAAAALFLGSAVSFVRPGETRKGTNKGHVGYLLSAGERHIRQNVLIRDDWWEFEWKLKGDREFQDDRLSWSFRLGTKQHAHPEIADTVYVGLRRSNLDYRAPFLAWLTNTEGELLVAATTDEASLARVELLAEKRYPIQRWGFALALQVGAIVENHRMYRGTLGTDGDNFILVFRPNLEF